MGFRIISIILAHAHSRKPGSTSNQSSSLVGRLVDLFTFRIIHLNKLSSIRISLESKSSSAYFDKLQKSGQDE